jgi:HEAT repeat protein
MNESDTCTLGTGPRMSEVRDYYLRADILAELSHLTQVRDIELIYRTADGEEPHVQLEPKTAGDLEAVFRRLFDAETGLAPNYYPWLHCWPTRAYETDEKTGERRLIGFDSGRELDYSWRRSFAELLPGMAVLDELGIYYRVKFSGHRSLHLCIPAEAVPERYRSTPEGDWSGWRDAVNTVGAFVNRCGCGDALWSQMAGEEPFSGVYSVHRKCGLVGVPLLPTDCSKFRPWMATVHLAAPVPSWWEVPPDAQGNFERALSRIEAGTVVHDMASARTAGVRSSDAAGYVGPATTRARQAANRSVGVESQGFAAWRRMVRGERASDEELLLALDGEDDNVRWFALEAWREAGETGVPDAELLRSVQRGAGLRQRYVREAATDVLMQCGEAGFVLLLELAGGKRQWKKDGSGPSRRRRIFHEIWALWQYALEGGDSAAAKLAELAERGGVEVSRGVCAILERCGEIGIATLVKLASSPRENTRQEALVALMYLGEAALPVLERTIAETEGEGRELVRRIRNAATRLGSGEALCWAMRPSTLATVVALGDERAAKQLGQILESGDKRESYHAARGLVYVGPESAEVLTDALNSGDPLVRRRACEALRDLAAPEARAPLISALGDPDVVVRVNAVRALARIDQREDTQILVDCAGDPSRAVRRAVREALA